VEFYPPDEERTLAVLSGNGAVQLWDIATRALIRPTLDTGLETEAFVVSPEGNFVYLGSFDERVERWSLDVHAWQEAGCAIAARTLTTAEWEQYLEDTPFAPLCATP
jgi:WD40 repeat protein